MLVAGTIIGLGVLNLRMLRNYVRIAYRTLLKNKAFSFINLFGLAVGMAAFLFINQISKCVMPGIIIAWIR